jgi:hypothetical protein
MNGQPDPLDALQASHQLIEAGAAAHQLAPELMPDQPHKIIRTGLARDHRLYRWKKIECPACHRKIAETQMNRHLKAKHGSHP